MSKNVKESQNVPVATGKGGDARQLAQRSPGAVFEDLRREFEDFWMRPWRGFRSRPWPTALAGRAEESWLPSTDVIQTGGALVVKADLPGLTRDDVKVILDNGDLVIQGERKQESKVEEKDYLRSECSYGSFYRRLPLPEGVDHSKIAAKVADGVLEVTVPLPPAATQAPQSIEVR
jgi:HSP20 family protein